MEMSVDTDHMQSKNETSKIPDIATACEHSHIENDSEDKRTCKACNKVFNVCKKIASQEWSGDQKNSFKSVKLEKIRRCIDGSKYNVLKKHVTETDGQSILRKTKIINKNVPDRLGKYISSYGVRSETKLLLGDCKLKRISFSNECSDKGIVESSEECSIADNLFDEFSRTRLSLLKTECLNNNEAVSLENNFESDSKSKNIFENFFDDCLGSTSKKRKDVSSQEKVEENGRPVNLESQYENSFVSYAKGSEKQKETEKTPVKKRGEPSIPATPVKMKDHNNYYNSHKSIRHVCTYCQKIFKSNGKLNSHVFSHTGERPFDCSHCGKAFSSKFKLVRHLLIHSEIRKFVCQICDRTFLRNDHLKNHYKVHDPKKKMYKCPKENCDKKYSSVMSHKKHMAYHNVEDGDLKCLICNVKYETKEEILFHLKSHSGSRLFKSQSDRKFKCEFCERLFLTRKDVTRHLVVHTGERDFLCQFCPQRFGRKDHLVRHIKKGHGNEKLPVKTEAEGKKVKEVRRSTEAKAKKGVGGTTKKFSTKRDFIFIPNETFDAGSKENDGNTHGKESVNETRMMITVQGKSTKKTKKKMAEAEGKSIDDSSGKRKLIISKKRQHSSTKSGKHSTAQILLHNIPNILIIPNNSIILVRNESTKSSKSSGEEDETDGGVETFSSLPLLGNEGNESKEIFLGPAGPTPNYNGSDNFNLNFNYEPNLLHSSHFLDGDAFADIQPNLLPYYSNFRYEADQLDFEMINQIDLLPASRQEVSLNSLLATDEDPNLETSRRMGKNATTVKSEREKADYCGDIEKELFPSENENVMLSESILNDFKDDSAAILSTENNGGPFSNVNGVNQSGDNCSFELLRSLLTTENPVLSPLPGFNQIFQNSNANSN